MKLSEIFESIQGESIYTGLLTTFVRLYGCSAGCKWCDTGYSYSGHNFELSAKEAFAEIVKINNKFICITGGEPLEQKREVLKLINLLSASNKGYIISLETNGFEDVSSLPANVHIVMDYKLPSSGTEGRKVFFHQLKYTDEIKLVIASPGDFYYAIELIEPLSKRVSPQNIIFSSTDNMRTWLAEKMIEFKLPVRFGYQLHKLLDVK